MLLRVRALTRRGRASVDKDQLVALFPWTCWSFTVFLPNPLLGLTQALVVPGTSW